MNELKECPCGKTPKKLIITDAGQGGKWANVGGDCCEYWEVEFRTEYCDMNGSACMVLAVKEWNEAKRGSIPISKLEELIKDLEGSLIEISKGNGKVAVLLTIKQLQKFINEAKK